MGAVVTKGVHEMRGFPSAFGAQLVLMCLARCGPVPDSRADVDLCPPSIVSVRATGPREVEIVFDETASLRTGALRFIPALELTGAAPSGTVVTIGVTEQVPGLRYALEAEAEDSRGNTRAFLAEFYGFNPRVPRILINEFITRGSDAHPDLVELILLSDGDMGGLVICQGTDGDFENRLVFPSFPVKAGDFILVHFKPSGQPGELDETSDRTASSGVGSCGTAFDFWVPDGKGLGGNNGVLSLYDMPSGALLDGVLYSNRTSRSDQLYRGFGSSATLSRAEELVREGGWKIHGGSVAPEDAVNPDGSTSTRSLCRGSSSVDTNDRSDWHIVPTRKSSFGEANSDEVYAP
jgi:hypothetical protein